MRVSIILLFFLFACQTFKVKSRITPIKHEYRKGGSKKVEINKGEPSKREGSKSESGKGKPSMGEDSKCGPSKVEPGKGCVPKEASTYPVYETLNEAEREKCPNKDIKEKGFWIDRLSEGGGTYRFAVSVERVIKKEEEELARLIAEKGGICDEVTTDGPSRGCGLAKYLMRTCYLDPEILGKEEKGVEPLYDKKWEDEPLKSEANQYCKTIAYTHCAPEHRRGEKPTPNRACVAYMRGAVEAMFSVLFVYKGPGGAMDIFDLQKVTLKFGHLDENANRFVKEHGAEWFFCKCREEQKDKCMKMIKDTF